MASPSNNPSTENAPVTRPGTPVDTIVRVRACTRCGDDIHEDIPDCAAFLCEHCWWDIEAWNFDRGQIFTYKGEPVTIDEFYERYPLNT